MEFPDIQGELEVKKADQINSEIEKASWKKKREELTLNLQEFYLSSGTRIRDAHFLDAESRYLLLGLVGSINASGIKPRDNIEIMPRTPLDIDSEIIRSIIKLAKTDKSDYLWCVNVDIGIHKDIRAYGAEYYVVNRATVFEDETIRYVSGYDREETSTRTIRAIYVPENNKSMLRKTPEELFTLEDSISSEVIKESILDTLLRYDIDWVAPDSSTSSL